MSKKILVAGSAGFIGSNLCKKLEQEDNYVVGVDIEEHKYYTPKSHRRVDLRKSIEVENFFYSFNEFDEIYILAAFMGGMEYLCNKEHNYDVTIGSTEIISNILNNAIKQRKSPKVFYASSACIYPEHLQLEPNVTALKEKDGIPANPDLLYGWQKIFGEKMMLAAKDTYGLDIRIGRFHNVFGEYTQWANDKAKAPAAICRKVIQAENNGEIEVFGDGLQTRSFLYIDEALNGIELLMNSNFSEPLNIGSSELIAINDLAKMVIDISGKNLTIKNIESTAIGVRGRNSDNTLINEVLGWQPTQSLRIGMEKLYKWIETQTKN